ELDHGVDDRLRVNHDLDVVIVNAEQLVGLDDLETLVHESGRVDGVLRPHVPGRVGQRLLDGDVGQVLDSPAAERPPAGGEHDAPHLGPPPGQSARPRVQGCTLRMTWISKVTTEVTMVAPTRPSHVLLGLMRGASGVRPVRPPMAKAPTS